MGVWRKCGSCKKDINLGAIYQMCSVSTCRKLAFCSVDCWSEHVPVMNHKSAWAEESRAPMVGEAQEGDVPRRIIVSTAKSPAASGGDSELSDDILIVASKLKAYVKARHGLNTSAEVMEKLSQLVRELADDACQSAQGQGRKTLMDRDFADHIRLR